MAFSFTCNSLNFTFDAYDMFNPSPTYPNGYVKWNNDGEFMQSFNSTCSKLDIKAIADAQTLTHGQDPTTYTSTYHIWTLAEHILAKDSYQESDYTNEGYHRLSIDLITYPGNDPYTTVKFYYERSHTLNPWNTYYTGTAINDMDFRPNDVMLNPGGGQLIFVLTHPWEDYEGDIPYYKEYQISMIYNINHLTYLNSSMVDYPDYRSYEDAYTVDVLSEHGFPISGDNLKYVYNRNGQPYTVTSLISSSFVDVQHLLDALRYVNEHGGDSGGNASYINPEDPDDDTSDGGGGGDDGDYSQSDGGDEIDFSEDPGLDGMSTGFVKVYAPDTTQMQALSNYMLSTAFIDNVKKLYANPMDYILGLKILPFKPGISGSEEVTVGGVGTNVYMSKVSSRWKNINCGSVNVIERFGGYMDYAPYTKVAIFLPFIGVKELNTDEVTGTKDNIGKVTVKYKVDVVTGECIAEVKCKNKKGLNAVCYAFNGNCATDIPITQRDTTKILSGFVGGVSAAAVTGISAMSGNVAGMVGGSIAGLTSIMQSKPTYAHSGNFSGSSGFLGRYKPFLIIESPIQSLSSNFVAQRGYPSNVGKTIGDFDGFTSFNSVRLHDIYSFTLDEHGNKTISSAATQDEIAEIREILKEGVYL